MKKKIQLSIVFLLLINYFTDVQATPREAGAAPVYRPENIPGKINCRFSYYYNDESDSSDNGLQSLSSNNYEQTYSGEEEYQSIKLADLVWKDESDTTVMATKINDIKLSFSIYKQLFKDESYAVSFQLSVPKQKFKGSKRIVELSDNVEIDLKKSDNMLTGNTRLNVAYSIRSKPKTDREVFSIKVSAECSVVVENPLLLKNIQ